MDIFVILWAVILFGFSLMLFFIWGKLLIINRKIESINQILNTIKELKQEANEVSDLTLLD